ncbi:MAG TPA: S8 family serine peptidase [Candidatus Limnocylindrales bacterium]|nr:S8 family serine peptidase [Candidatus Limnocylindrales bacterium]
MTRLARFIACALALSVSAALWVPPALAAVHPVHAPVPHGAPPRRTPKTLSFAPREVVVIADAEALDAAADGSPLTRNLRAAGVLASLGLDRARAVGPVRRPNGSRRERTWVLTCDRTGFDPPEAARALQATGAFRAVSPNYRFGLFITQPNDPYLYYQWYVDDGDFADIRLPYAWDIARGDTSVVIAILDTGVDTSHPDLASRIWRNPGEIPGNGLDDDGNGFVDDVEGWDFGVGDNDPNPEYTSDASGIDVGFHGTFCAGIAAAATDNNDGIAGAGWNCRIMPLKVAHPDSGITSEAIAGAFQYAVDERASVVSMSFGGPGDPGVPEFFQALVDMATRAGAVCVAAAGNDGDSVRVYPAACDHVLAVGATDFNNVRADFSNWGSWVDVAAPGSTMWSTISQNYTFTDLDQLFYIFLFGWDGVDPYMYGDGTSFACPLAAGVCGLVRARYPSLTPELVIQQVIATGDAVAYDHPVGVKVNASRAVTSGPTAVALDSHVPAFSLAGAAPNPMAGSGAIRFTLKARGRTRLTLYDASGRRVRVLVDATLDAGPHAVPWDGRNDAGARAATGVYFARLMAGGSRLDSKVLLLAR